ncbi:high affinity immunoglobulin gamma Fc receptor I-like isoform X2 [Serinus canaria]|uniref:high affinity immunoglobulin gamma Fc receptor I-like isoform X2 n=1 Tax=Serinus canaria TaxID=9135 RepID=UPI0021CC64EA|nr:high affinity immunoglobulin gamma Fc receptor I-like isoform X2 [Serinus canaria]
MAGDTGMAGKVALLLWGAQTTQLLVDPPWVPPVKWDHVKLTCRSLGTTGATTWYKDGQIWRQEGEDHVTVTESGTYTCDRSGSGLSPPVTVSDERLVLQVPSQALLEGDTVTLRCQGLWNDLVTSVSFNCEGKELGRLHDGTELTLSPLQLQYSGRYHCKCRVEYRAEKFWESALVTVTVHVPVANATISPGPLSHQVHAGDNVTLRCSVQVGSAPVNFTWLHNRKEVARGPLLELRDIDKGHSGTYQCVATNQLGQDRHRVFRALSPELALEVTPGSPWVTGGVTWGHQGGLNPRVMGYPDVSPLFLAVVAGVGGALLFLLLLMVVILAWHLWHRVAARKNQQRAPPDLPAPPEEGEVLYTHVVVTKRAGASPRATTFQDPQVTYAELRGHQGRPREPGDISGNVL